MATNIYLFLLFILISLFNSIICYHKLILSKQYDAFMPSSFLKSSNSDSTTTTNSPLSVNPGLSTVSTGPIKKKVYEPRADNKRPVQHQSWTKPSQNAKRDLPSTFKKDEAILLTKPQLLIRYRVPKEKSELKIRLEQMQDSFRQQADEQSSSYSSYSSSSDRFSGTAGSSSTSDVNSAGFRGGANKKVKPKSKDDDRRGETTNRRDKKSNDDSDDDFYEYDEGSNSNDPFGSLEGEDDSYVSLSELPAGVLREMVAEGFTIDDIQISIFGEYGIKASIQAIKQRLLNDKSERKRKVKTGKTRREKNKARNAKFRVEESNNVVLPKSGVIQVMELARLIGVGGGEVVKHLMMNVGMMVTMTQNVDLNVARQTVLAFGKTLDEDEETAEDDDDTTDDDSDGLDDPMDVMTTGDAPLIVPRSPIVTIMGHVDHGKTTLLDRIRTLASASADGEAISKNFVPVAPNEAGGITQSISAFKVKTGMNREVTFFDTPGHAAFSEMRKRGANVTDIVVLVVAADDGIMEQTKECIFAAKAAGCPIVVAVNKIDKEGADSQKVMTDLMNYDVLVEDFGGEVQIAKLSAKKGIGIEGLLEKILLQADVMDLKAKLNVKPSGTVIESRIDKRLGIVATVLVQKGTLKVGDILLAGKGWGRVRKMLSDQGEELKEAGPSTPVQLLGFSTIPAAGDEFGVVDDESAARDVAEARVRLARQASASSSLASMISQAASLSEGGIDNREIMKVPLVLKADVSGSVEALKTSLDGIRESDHTAICAVDIVQAGIGDITASDVAIAAVSKAKILAFNVAVKSNVMEIAKSANVEIGFYNVVYDLLDEIAKKVKETLSPPPPGILVGKAEIKKSFKVGKAGKVAGCIVTEGLIRAGSKVRIMRGSRNPVYSGLMSSLRFGKDTIEEVIQGSECGISFVDFQDFEEGDVVECFSSNNAEESES